MPRLLFLADTHLGFDQPKRPRIERRRRGPDFFNAFTSALQAAVQSQVDGVIHGGDLFFRSKVPTSLVEQAFEPLLRLASNGLPIYIVPGNHERSVIPTTLFTQHPNIHIFHEPRTFVLTSGDTRIALSGLPFIRHNVRGQFHQALERTAWRTVNADVKLLCLHQSIQGAVVGTHEYVFRSGPDIVPTSAIPVGFDAVLCGHIHRHQVLRQDMSGRKLHFPIIYAGSTERTSFAEMNEAKGYIKLEVSKETNGPDGKIQWQFHPLTTRPMVKIEIAVDGCTVDKILRKITARFAAVPRDGIVQLRFTPSTNRGVQLPSAAAIRAITPPEMNVSVVFKRQ